MRQFINVFRASCIMRRTLVFSILVVSVISNEEGQYNPDFFDARGVDDGRYIPDDSGRYIPDDSGQYYPDDSGKYLDDGNGKYSGGKNFYTPYKGDKYRPGSSGRFAGSKVVRIPTKSTIKTKPESRTPPSFTPNLILVDSRDFGKDSNDKSDYRNNESSSNHLNAGNTFGNIPSGTSHTASKHFVSERAYPTKYPQGKWRIIKQSGDVGTDGYHWDFETENGITAQEAGSLANRGSDAEVMRAKGFFKYTGPDNVVYQITYTADENGFVAKGNHLPTPPSIPPAIFKSLEYQKAAGKL